MVINDVFVCSCFKFVTVSNVQPPAQATSVAAWPSTSPGTQSSGHGSREGHVKRQQNLSEAERELISAMSAPSEMPYQVARMLIGCIPFCLMYAGSEMISQHHVIHMRFPITY